ncbi:MAG: hypothetical protein JOZ15_08720, partial [Acidobacteria bacterium]|nr:hypothetical protein [Acidobacteriota bacterium]
MQIRGSSGFSMIETLIAAALIGVVAIGIIPMFTRAMSDNMAGSDYTRVTNYAKSKEEDFSRMPFTQPTIQVQSGQNNLMTTEYMDPTTLQWTLTKPSNPLAIWTRTTTITQYSIYGTVNGTAPNQYLTFDASLPGGSPVDEVQIMQDDV